MSRTNTTVTYIIKQRNASVQAANIAKHPAAMQSSCNTHTYAFTNNALLYKTSNNISFAMLPFVTHLYTSAPNNLVHPVYVYNNANVNSVVALLKNEALNVNKYKACNFVFA